MTPDRPRCLNIFVSAPTFSTHLAATAGYHHLFGDAAAATAVAPIGSAAAVAETLSKSFPFGYFISFRLERKFYIYFFFL